MKSNTRLVGAVLVGMSACVLANLIHSNRTQNKKVTTKKLAKEAFQSWEGEGGNIIDPLPRPTSS